MSDQVSLFEQEDIYEYFFIISPDDKTKHHVKFLKEKLHGEIGLSKANLWSVAHVSLFKIRLAINAQTLITLLNDSLKEIQCFEIALNGNEIFEHGKNKRSFVLKIENPEPIKIIFKLLAGVLGLKANEINPHITIAKEIAANDLEKISFSRSEYDCKEMFWCNKITVLRKPSEKNIAYEEFYKIPLLI